MLIVGLDGEPLPFAGADAAVINASPGWGGSKMRLVMLEDDLTYKKGQIIDAAPNLVRTLIRRGTATQQQETGIEIRKSETQDNKGNGD